MNTAEYVESLVDGITLTAEQIEQAARILATEGQVAA